VMELPIDYATGSVDGSSLANGRYTVRVIASNTVYAKALLIID